jgi:hypothetical protein
VRFRQYAAYSENKQNYRVLANMSSETEPKVPKVQSEPVCFRRQRGICKNLSMQENFTFILKNVEILDFGLVYY